MAAIEKVLCGIWCTLKTNVSMQGVEPAKIDPELKDPSILNRLKMENEIFKAHWAWINTKFLADDSAATGFPPPAVTLANLLAPANLGSIGSAVASALTKLIPGAPIMAAVADVASALGTPAAPPATAAPK